MRRAPEVGSVWVPKGELGCGTYPLRKVVEVRLPERTPEQVVVADVHPNTGALLTRCVTVAYLLRKFRLWRCAHVNGHPDAEDACEACWKEWGT